LDGFPEDSSSEDSVDLEKAINPNQPDLATNAKILEIENKISEKVSVSEMSREIELQIKAKTFVDQTILEAKFEIWRQEIIKDQTSQSEVINVKIEISNLHQMIINLENEIKNQPTQQQQQPTITQAPDIVPNEVFDDFSQPIRDGNFDGDLFNRLNEKIRNFGKKLKKVEKSFSVGMSQSMEQVCVKNDKKLHFFQLYYTV